MKVKIRFFGCALSELLRLAFFIPGRVAVYESAWFETISQIDEPEERCYLHVSSDVIPFILVRVIAYDSFKVSPDKTF
jgi:hypothetical protein